MDSGGIDGICRVGWGWAAVAVVALMYASLIPFDLSLASVTGATGWTLPRLGIPMPGAEDLLTNIVVYLPLGFLIVLLRRDCRRTALARIALAVAVGALVSVTVELLQVVIASRVASWFDVGLNVFGVACGASLAALLAGPLGAVIRRLGRTLAGRPFSLVASVVTLGLLFFNLAPFDFVTDTAGLWESFSKSRWDVSVMGPSSATAAPFAAFMNRVHGAAWYAILGYALVLSARELGRGKREAPVLALTQGAALIGAIAVLQLFMLSHPFDMGRILLSGFGIIAGVWTAVFVVDVAGERAWRDGRGLAVPTPILMAACLFEIAALWLSPLDAVLLASGPDPSRITWLPFYLIWQEPMINAACAVGSALAVYGVLALTVGTLLRRGGIRQPWLMTACVAVCVAFVQIGVESATVTSSVDATGSILALAATVFVARAHAMTPLPALQRVRGV